MDYQTLKYQYHTALEKSLSGRFIPPKAIASLIDNLPSQFSKVVIGLSEEKRTIHSLEFGNGPIKVLAWSQMHGNESTTTKAIFDFLNWISRAGKDDELQREILDRFTVAVVPILNPDGALRYTRTNANDVDLNRDAQDLTQSESKALKELYLSFQPHYCLNLHGQRTIFGVGVPPTSATMSFLAPAFDGERSVSLSRAKAMRIISRINGMLQQIIPKGVGTYDDSFNINCVGDTFQKLGTPTILFEAGHFPDDYGREYTRMLVFMSYIQTFEAILEQHDSSSLETSGYFDIPQNKKCFYDFIVRNISLPNHGTTDLAIQYDEILKNKELNFVPKIAKIGNLSDFSGHKEYDAKCSRPSQTTEKQWQVERPIEKLFLNTDFTITFSQKRNISL